MKILEELRQTFQHRRGNIITWIVMLVIFTVALFINPSLLTIAFESIWNILIIGISSTIFILIALGIRVLFPESFKILFNLVHYTLVILILSSAIRWNLEPENHVYEPLITLFAFFVAVMVYLRQNWNISENKHEIVELFKSEQETQATETTKAE